MDKLTKVAVLDNIVEAQVLESILEEQGIPHVTKTYHDSACDGLFQKAMGWGHVEAEERFAPEILAILNALRERPDPTAKGGGDSGEPGRSGFPAS